MLLPPYDFKFWLHCKISMLPSGRSSTTAAFSGSSQSSPPAIPILFPTLTISAASSQQLQHQNRAAELKRSSPYTCTPEGPHAPCVQTKNGSGKSMVFHRAKQTAEVVSSPSCPSQNYREGHSMQNKTPANLSPSANCLIIQSHEPPWEVALCLTHAARKHLLMCKYRTALMR